MDEAWRKVDELSRQGRWGDAGPGWLALAHAALARRQEARAHEAASRAADAFRRDDRPEKAVIALGMARRIGPDRALDQVQYAAVCLDAGRVAEAVETASAARANAGPVPERAVALDTLVGAHLAADDVDAAREALTELERLDFDGARIARLYRGAQVDRRDGQLERADDAWARVIEALQPFHAAAPGEAAAWDERAEVALLRAALARHLGRSPAPWLDAARECSDEGATAWRKAQRRSGQLRNELLVARIAAVGGEPLPVDLCSQIHGWAKERGMWALAWEAEGWAVVYRRSRPPPRGPPRPDLRPAVWLAEQGGEVDLDALVRDLVQDLPWKARVLFRIGAVRGDADALREAEGIAEAALARGLA
jgi:tetratricopeptide (TPR) repeat protein